MLAAAQKAGVTLGVISQRRFYEPVRRMKAAIDAGKIGTPALGVFTDVQLARPGLLPLRPVARQVGHRGRRRAGQPVAAPARPAAVAHGAGRGGERLLGQPQPPGRRGGRHRRGDASASRTAGWARSSRACRRSRASTRRSTSTASNGASVGVETDRGATFIAGVSAIAEPPLNDLWTVPGEEASACRVPGRGPRTLRPDERDHALSRACRSRTSSGPCARADRRW